MIKIVYVNKDAYYGIESPEECPFHGHYGDYCTVKVNTRCEACSFTKECPLEERI